MSFVEAFAHTPRYFRPHRCYDVSVTGVRAAMELVQGTAELQPESVAVYVHL